MRRTIQNKYKRPTGPQSRDTLVLPLQACTPVVSVVLYSQRGTDTTLLHVTISISTHQRDATQPGERYMGRRRPRVPRSHTHKCIRVATVS